MNSLRGQLGATLIEMLVSIVIISIAVVGVMMVVSNTTRSSADPMIRSQAISIADAYLQEILSQAISDPAGSDVSGPEAGESRATFDDVTDYNGLADNAGAVDQNGNPIAGLEGYNVGVVVSAATLNSDPANHIVVTVSYDGDPDFSLSISSYRLN